MLEIYWLDRTMNGIKLTDFMSFNWKILGHDSKLEELSSDILSGNIAHAYLFSGVSDIGKYSLAKNMAKVLQCSNGGCDDCVVCREIDNGLHADTMEIDDDGEMIKIAAIRAAIEKLNLSKQSKFRILLMENIERMNIEASNALLKTLEDPPDGVIFILTTSNIDAILATIISRVRLLKFKPLSDLKLRELLENRFPLIDGALIDEVLGYANGRVGNAIRFLDDSEAFDDYKKTYSEVESLFKESLPDKIGYVGEIIKSSQEDEDKACIKEFLDLLIVILRKKMHVAASENIKEASRLAKCIEGVSKAKALLKNNINTKLLLENLMINL